MLALLGTMLTLMLFVLPQTAYAQNGTCAPDDIDCQLQNVFEKRGREGGPELGNFANRFHELSSVESGADTLTSIIFIALDFIKYILGAITVIFVTITGVKLVVSGSKADEEFDKAKKALKYIIMALVLVIISDELVTKVFFGEYGECIASSANAQQCAQEGATIIKGLYSFVLAMVASIAIFMLVYSGFRMITFYDNEEELNKYKKQIVWAIAGLVLAGIAEFAVKGVVFPEAGERLFDVDAGIQLVSQLTNFAAGFIAAGSFVILFYGGYLYVASFGNEELTGKAKKIIMGAIIGMLIALVAFGAVTTVASLSSGREAGSPVEASLEAATR